MIVVFLTKKYSVIFKTHRHSLAAVQCVDGCHSFRVAAELDKSTTCRQHTTVHHKPLFGSINLLTTSISQYCYVPFCRSFTWPLTHRYFPNRNRFQVLHLADTLHNFIIHCLPVRHFYSYDGVTNYYAGLYLSFSRGVSCRLLKL